jgi:hypothetical protein
LVQPAPVLDVLPAGPAPRPRLKAQPPPPAPKPRKGRTLLGCFMLAVLIILSITGLAAFGIYLIVDRASHGISRIFEDAVKESRTWEEVSRNFTPPATDVKPTELWPAKIGDWANTEENVSTAIPELGIDQKGRHGVYVKKGSKEDVHLYFYQPVTKLEKEVIFRRAMDVAQKKDANKAGGISVVNGGPQNDKLTIHVERHEFATPIRVRAVLWWSHDCLFVLRSPVGVNPEPLLSEYLQWLAAH